MHNAHHAQSIYISKGMHTIKATSFSNCIVIYRCLVTHEARHHKCVLPAQGACTEGAVRLEDGEREHEGRIGLCYRGEWGSVCDESTNDHTAEVVCAQLQLPLESIYIL